MLGLLNRHRSLWNAVPDAVTLHDENGTILDANPAAELILGYSRKQLIGMSVLDLNPSLSSDHMSAVFESFRIGEIDSVETINRRADGTIFPIEVHSNSFLEDGKFRIVAIARDITTRAQAERALRSSEARYSQLLDVIDKGIMTFDREGRISRLNQAACRILQITPDQLLGSKGTLPWTFVDQNGEPLSPEGLPHMVAMRELRVIESTMLGVFANHLSNYIWLMVTSVPQFLDDETDAFQVISMFSDVTKLKRESAMFRQTESIAGIGSWEFDFLRNTIYWTDELYRLHAIHPNTPLNWKELIRQFPPHDALLLTNAFEQLRNLRTAFDLDLRMTSRIGENRWLRVRGEAVVNSNHVVGAIGNMQDITARKSAEELHKLQAMTDSLTAVATRDAVIMRMQSAIEQSTPYSAPCLIYIDLDRFKVVNDLLGHNAGDNLLAAAAHRIRSQVPSEAVVGRFGGDEFAVLLPSTSSIEKPVQIAQAITRAFAKPFDYDAEDFSITASLGLARYPEDGTTTQQLINHADAAMFDAKRRGRNQWQVFTPALARKLTDRLQIETQLRRALDNNEFRLLYQPKIELGSGRVIGAEALLRWNNRQLGELSPDVFIPHAETTGDIVRIGAWVIQQSIKQLRSWRDQGLMLENMAVNVSFRQFLSEGLSSSVSAALEQYDIPGSALELEMTERVLIEDTAETSASFSSLKALGVAMTIDDFGEGYSSLNYLTRLPIDGIKISHTFMHEIPLNASHAVVCESIIRIAQSLGLKVVAEGIERQDQLDFLRLHGTKMGQGFFFSKALDANQFVSFCNSR